MRLSTVMAATAMLGSTIAGCGALPPAADKQLASSLPAGSRLVVHQGIAILPHAARVYVQGGQVMPLPKINRQAPHCRIDLYQMADTHREILPGKFEIVRTADGIERDTRRAAVTPGAPQTGTAAGAELYTTYFYLRSPTQKAVAALACQQLADPANPRHVTVGQIRQVLGELATLEPGTAPGK